MHAHSDGRSKACMQWTYAWYAWARLRISVLNCLWVLRHIFCHPDLKS